jgi:hypothetical protein
MKNFSSGKELCGGFSPWAEVKSLGDVFWCFS